MMPLCHLPELIVKRVCASYVLGMKIREKRHLEFMETHSEVGHLDIAPTQGSGGYHGRRGAMNVRPGSRGTML